MRIPLLVPRYAVLSILIVATTAAPSRAAPAGDGRDAAIETASRLLEGRMDSEGIPGMSVAVMADGELLWNEAFGLANVELGTPATPATRFRLGSVSKILTASLVARLWQQGDIELDVDVREYVPDLPEVEGVVSLRLLLGHLAGIRHYERKDFDPSMPGGIIDLRLYPSVTDALELFANDPLVAPPGERYSYSTFGYTLVMAALEGATGQTFPELLRSELLGPLELTAVVPDELTAIIPGRTGFDDKSADGALLRSIPVNPAYKWAGGGLLGTAEDLARFGAFHVEPGFFEAGTLEEMFVSQITTGGEETGVGLGWRVGTDSVGRRIVHHEGAMAGCRACLLVLPDEGIAVALLSNLARTPGDVLDVALSVAEAFRTAR